MKVYISGRITGVEQQAKEQFAKAEALLIKMGHQAVNPFNLEHNHDKSWQQYMKICLKAMMECDAICMLPNWHLSRGANIERQLALYLSFNIIDYDEENNHEDSKICKWHSEPYCCNNDCDILYCTGKSTIKDCKFYDCI